MNIEQQLLLHYQLYQLKDKMLIESATFYEKNIAELYLLRKSCEKMGIPFKISRFSNKEKENDEQMAKESSFLWILNDHALFNRAMVDKTIYLNAIQKQNLECFEKSVDFLLDESHVRWKNSDFHDELLNLEAKFELSHTAFAVSSTSNISIYECAGLFFHEKDKTFSDLEHHLNDSIHLKVCNAQNVEQGIDILNQLKVQYGDVLQYFGEPEKTYFSTHFDLEKKIEELLRHCQTPNGQTTSLYVYGLEDRLQSDGSGLCKTSTGFIYLDLNNPDTFRAFQEMNFAYGRFYEKMHEYSYPDTDFSQTFFMLPLPLVLQHPKFDMGQWDVFTQNEHPHFQFIKNLMWEQRLKKEIKNPTSNQNEPLKTLKKPLHRF